MEGVNFQMVTQEVWDYLQRIYGSGPTICRPSVGVGIFLRLHLELFPVRILLGFSHQTSNNKVIVSFSPSQQLKDIRLCASQITNNPPHSFLLTSNRNGVPYCFNEEEITKTLEELGIGDGSAICALKMDNISLAEFHCFSFPGAVASEFAKFKDAKEKTSALTVTVDPEPPSKASAFQTSAPNLDILGNLSSKPDSIMAAQIIIIDLLKSLESQSQKQFEFSSNLSHEAQSLKKFQVHPNFRKRPLRKQKKYSQNYFLPQQGGRAMGKGKSLEKLRQKEKSSPRNKKPHET